jgi:O-antigen/teichoic acid export membrane protein
MYVLVMSLVDYGGILDLGIRTTLQRFVGRLKGQADAPALNEIMTAAVALSSGTAALFGVLTGIGMYLLPTFFGQRADAATQFRWLLLLMGLSVAILLPGRVLGSYLCGLQRFDLFNLISIVIQLLRAGGIVAALLASYGVIAVAAVTLATNFLYLILNWLAIRQTDPLASVHWRHFRWARAREIMGYSFYVVLNAAGDYFRYYSYSIVIARLLSIALITPVSVAVKILSYMRTIVGGLASPLMPRMGELDAQNRKDELRRLFLRSTRASTLLSLFIGSLIILNGKTMLVLWLGPQFRSAYPFLAVLAVGSIAIGSQLPSAMLMYALGAHKPLGCWTFGEGIVNLALSVILARQFGVMGVVVAMTAPMLVTSLVAQPYYALRLTGMGAAAFFRQAVWRPLFACGIFGAVCLLVPGQGDGAGFARFAVTLAWQAALYGLLMFMVALPAADRLAIRERAVLLRNRLFGGTERQARSLYTAAGESREINQ